MLADYHIHTSLCKHAQGENAVFAAKAYAHGLPEIAFADHAPAPDGYDSDNRMDLGEFPGYRASIRGLRELTVCPRVLYGIEADYYPGCLDTLGPWLAGEDFDIVLGSVHYIGDWGFDHPDNLPVWKQANVKETWQRYFELIVELVDTGLFDVLSHLDLPKKFGHRLGDRDLKEMAQPALDRVAASGMGIELNTSGLRKPVAEIYPSPLLLDLARERNIPICFGSDAHQPEEVGYAFDRALKLARAAGYTHCLRFAKRERRLVPLPGTSDSPHRAEPWD